MVSVRAREEARELFGHAHHLGVVQLQLTGDVEHTPRGAGGGRTADVTAVVVIDVKVVVVIVIVSSRGHRHATTPHAHGDCVFFYYCILGTITIFSEVLFS